MNFKWDLRNIIKRRKGMSNQQYQFSTNNVANTNQTAVQTQSQQNLWNQGQNQLMPYSLQGLGSTITTQSYGYGTSILDLDSKRKEIESQLEAYSKSKRQKEILEELSPQTIEITKIIRDIQASSNLEDILKLDKYVKSILFTNKLNNIID